MKSLMQLTSTTSVKLDQRRQKKKGRLRFGGFQSNQRNLKKNVPSINNKKNANPPILDLVGIDILLESINKLWNWIDTTTNQSSGSFETLFQNRKRRKKSSKTMTPRGAGSRRNRYLTRID